MRTNRGRKLREQDPFAICGRVGKKLAPRVLVGPRGPEPAPNFDDHTPRLSKLTCSYGDHGGWTAGLGGLC